MLALFLAPSAYAEDCYKIKNPGYGAPDAFYLHECLGKEALKKGEYETAINNLTAALAQNIHEAPNYELRLELGEAYCKLGKINKGRKELNKFQCMVNADLGKMKCSNNREEILKDECMFLACEGSPSSLTSEGREALMKRYKLSEKTLSECK